MKEPQVLTSDLDTGVASLALVLAMQGYSSDPDQIKYDAGLGEAKLSSADILRLAKHYGARSPAQCRCPKKSDQSEDRFEAHALGRSKGGLSTKVHAVTDALGNPVRFILTGGERNDITQIEGLLNGLKSNYVLADKGYDDQRAMSAIATAGAKPVVPRRTTTAQWRPFDRELYKERNMIERFFSEIKNFRRIATRYDKLARKYMGFLSLVAALKCCP